MAAFFQAMDAERARRAAAARTGKNRVKGKGHPTTSDLVYSKREMEFLNAIEAFKASTGRKFPTWREVLGVVDSLGYRQPDDVSQGATRAA